jgi:hypothetical protein
VLSTPFFNLIIGLSIGGIGSFVQFFPLFYKGSATHLWANDLDPLLIHWIVSWGYHILFEQFDFTNFWNANSFFPEMYSLAFSDSMLSAQIFYAPLRFFGLAPFTALYLTLAGFTIFGCILTSLALNQLISLTTIEKIIIISSAHFCLCFTNFLYHYQLFGFHLAPSFFLYLYSYFRDWEIKALLYCCVISTIAVCFSIYSAPFLFSLSIILGVPFILYAILDNNHAIFQKRFIVSSLAILLFFSVFLYFIQLFPYSLVENKFGHHPLNDKIVYSANPFSIFSGYSENSYWYNKWARYAAGDWEHAYFPGYVALGSSILFFCFIIFGFLLKVFSQLARLKNKSFSMDRLVNFPVSAMVFFSLLFLSCLILSWGPFLKTDISMHLPFYYLSSFMPGIKSIRSPGRFGMFMGLPFGFFLVFNLRLIKLNRNILYYLPVIVLLFFAFESLPSFKSVPYQLEKKNIYQKLSEIIPQGTPILELPISGKSHYGTLKNILNQLQGSTYYWGRLAVGYGSKQPDFYLQLLYFDQLVQSDDISPEQIVNLAKGKKMPFILIHLDKYSKIVQDHWIFILKNNEGIEEIKHLNHSVLIKVKIT